MATNDQTAETTAAPESAGASPAESTEEVAGRGSGLELRQVSKHFADVVAVENVSLRIGNGEYVVLLGPSGCGKTTILRMIGGHEHPSGKKTLLRNGPELGDGADRHSSTSSAGSAGCSWPAFTGGLWHF